MSNIGHVVRPARLRGRRRSGFRETYRPRSRAHLIQTPMLPEDPQTCFEGPFGEVIRATGPLANTNPFRFSTKYQDDETDLLYYGYRYYNPSTGRWISRDPLGERGGINLCGFVQNDPTGSFDADGRESGGICPVCGQYFVGVCPRDGYPHTRLPPSLSQGNSCSAFPDTARGIQVANSALKQGACAKWFTEHGSRIGDSYSVNCHGKCKLVCLFGGTAWTYPGLNRIGLCPDNFSGLGPSGIASLLIHEAAHHYCPPIGFGGERCAEAAQEACGEFLTN